MSELINTNDNRATIHWKLLATASASALLAYLYSAGAVRAEDTERPAIWIELGGQLDALQGKDEIYAPPFIVANQYRPLNAVSLLSEEGAPNFAIGGEGKISFQPVDSSWIFSAGIRFGRSSGGKSVHQQTSTLYTFVGRTIKYKTFHGSVDTTRFNDIRTEHNEKHAVLDFMAGKDVGLGLFGKGGTSVFSAGVRIAQFHSHAGFNFMSLPDAYHGTGGVLFGQSGHPQHHHSYFATAEFVRDFRGIGPAISWTASAPVAGNPENGEITVDWGLNAAALFGNQKVRGSHQEKGVHFFSAIQVLHGHITQYTHYAPINRSRRVTVPNAGAFAGLSVRYNGAKISFGYRADMFFGAIDGGIDARKEENRGFYGPYASISVGLGD